MINNHFRFKDIFTTNPALLVHGKKDHWDNALDSQSQFASGSQVDFADSQAFGSQQPYYQNHGISQAPESPGRKFRSKYVAGVGGHVQESSQAHSARSGSLCSQERTSQTTRASSLPPLVKTNNISLTPSTGLFGTLGYQQAMQNCKSSLSNDDQRNQIGEVLAAVKEGCVMVESLVSGLRGDVHTDLTTARTSYDTAFSHCQHALMQRCEDMTRQLTEKLDHSKALTDKNINLTALCSAKEERVRVLEAEMEEMRREKRCEVVESVRRCVADMLQTQSDAHGELEVEVKRLGQHVTGLRQDVAQLTQKLTDLLLTRSHGTCNEKLESLYFMLEQLLSVMHQPQAVNKASQNTGMLQPVSDHVHPLAYKCMLTTQAEDVPNAHPGTRSHLVSPAQGAYKEQQCMSYASTQWPVAAVTQYSLQRSEQVLTGTGNVPDPQVTARVSCGTSVSTSLQPMSGDSGTSLRSMAAGDNLVVVASQKPVKSGCDTNKAGLSADRLNDLRFDKILEDFYHQQQKEKRQLPVPSDYSKTVSRTFEFVPCHPASVSPLLSHKQVTSSMLFNKPSLPPTPIILTQAPGNKQLAPQTANRRSKASKAALSARSTDRKTKNVSSKQAQRVSASSTGVKQPTVVTHVTSTVMTRSKKVQAARQPLAPADAVLNAVSETLTKQATNGCKYEHAGGAANNSSVTMCEYTGNINSGASTRKRKRNRIATSKKARNANTNLKRTSMAVEKVTENDKSNKMVCQHSYKHQLESDSSRHDSNKCRNSLSDVHMVPEKRLLITTECRGVASSAGTRNECTLTKHSRAFANYTADDGSTLMTKYNSFHEEVAVVASTDASPMSVSEHCYARTVEYEIRTPVARYHSVLTRNSPLYSPTGIDVWIGEHGDDDI